MRVGIDTYSYHRLHAVMRPDEPAAAHPPRSAWREDVADAVRLGVDTLALQTMFLGDPDALDCGALRDHAAGLELLLSWGGNEGFGFGATARIEEFNAWLRVASQLEVGLMRVVVGGPALRGREPAADQIRRVAPILRQACAAAGARGVGLAVENHGDLTVREVVELIELVDVADLGICLDVANIARLGEEPVATARYAARLVRLMHLRDCEDPSVVVNPVAGPRVRRYGEGVIPLEAVLEAAAEQGFDGPVCVELAQLGDEDEVALVDDCVNWLRGHAPLGSSRPSRI